MMSLRPAMAAAAAALLLSAALPVALAPAYGPALAHDGHSHATPEDAPIQVADAYARVTNAGSGAVFFALHNLSGADDRLVGIRTDAAEKAELHTHAMDADGVMKMVQIEGGIALPADALHELKRGGDHVMLMGLTQPLQDGDRFSLTLIFEKAGEITFEVAVDNARKPAEGGMGEMDHSAHGAGHGTGHGTASGG